MGRRTLASRDGDVGVLLNRLAAACRKLQARADRAEKLLCIERGLACKRSGHTYSLNDVLRIVTLEKALAHAVDELGTKECTRKGISMRLSAVLRNATRRKEPNRGLPDTR